MNLDPKTELTFEEVEQLFSATDELRIQKTSDPRLYEISLDESTSGLTTTYKLSRLSLQAILRVVHTMTFNALNGII